MVRDTDNALGRYSLRPKAVGLKDLARVKSEAMANALSERLLMQR